MDLFAYLIILTNPSLLSNCILLVLAARLGECRTGRVAVLHCFSLNHILVAGIFVGRDKAGGGWASSVLLRYNLA